MIRDYAVIAGLSFLALTLICSLNDCASSEPLSIPTATDALRQCSELCLQHLRNLEALDNFVVNNRPDNIDAMRRIYALAPTWREHTKAALQFVEAYRLQVNDRIAQSYLTQLEEMASQRDAFVSRVLTECAVTIPPTPFIHPTATPTALPIPQGYTQQTLHEIPEHLRDNPCFLGRERTPNGGWKPLWDWECDRQRKR